MDGERTRRDAAPDAKGFAAAFRKAEKLAAEGKTKEAIAAFETLAAAHPGDSKLLNNLGVLWRRAGDPQRGIGYLERALAADPGNADAHYNLANALADSEEKHRAAELYRKALRLRPDYAAACVNFARLLMAEGQAKVAKACLLRGVANAPSSAALRFQLGVLLMQEGKDAAALACYRIAAGLDPRDAKSRHNIASILIKSERYKDALDAADAALECDSGFAETHALRGQALIGLGRLGEAEAPLRRALALDPNNLSAALGLARMLLLAGRLEEGWPAYAARWRRTKQPMPKVGVPAWDGSDPRGKRLALVTEQGFGDSIQFIRYASVLATRGARVHVVCEPPLVRLFSRLKCVERVLPKGEPLPECDAYSPLLDLPRLLETDLTSIPASVPYLPSGAASEAGGGGGVPTVGIVWCGSRDHERDQSRSAPLEMFLPLLARIDVRFVSLQVGPGASDLARTGADALAIDLSPRIRDFADTADLMAAVDLIISVDTASAHLAGALGRPVWTLLSYAPDWRWLLGRDDSPWYPTMRLFRQTAAGEWDPVFRRVEQALDAFVAQQPTRRASRGSAAPR